VLASVVVATSALAGAPALTPEVLKNGKSVYEGAAGCVACHGASGRGDGPVAFALNPRPRDFTREPFKQGDSVEQVFATLTTGLAGTKMPGFPQIKEPDRWALAYYVVSFRPKK